MLFCRLREAAIVPAPGSCAPPSPMGLLEEVQIFLWDISRQHSASSKPLIRHYANQCQARPPCRLDRYRPLLRRHRAKFTAVSPNATGTSGPLADEASVRSRARSESIPNAESSFAVEHATTRPARDRTANDARNLVMSLNYATGVQAFLTSR